MAQENQKLKDDKTLEYDKLKVDIYNAETQRIRALSDNMVDGNDIELQAIQNVLSTGTQLHDAFLKAEQQGHQQEMDVGNQQLQAQSQAQTAQPQEGAM